MAIDWQIQPGPCVQCGVENYPLSTGGPGVCAMCDTLPPDKIVPILAQENKLLRGIIERLRIRLPRNYVALRKEDV